jgi:tetratricopeptide (TPR) repeat protein
MTGGDAGVGWDFFISYTQADRRWAEWIAWVLEEDGGYRVRVQAWDFVPGSNWIQEMQAGIRGASRTIAVLSDAYLSSPYGSAEWQAAWANDPGGANRKLLTIRVAECERPGLLAGVTGIDLFGIDETAARARLLETVSAAIAGRAKPATPPRYPGERRVVPSGPHFPGSLPRIWNVPTANPNFTGRGPELDKLARSLDAGSRVTVHSMHGMGGVGKTQLATEYAYTRNGVYDLVWWIAAEEPAAIPDQFTALATQLGFEAVTDPDTVRVQVHEGLRTVPGWLLIFDNADTVEIIRPWLPPGPLAAEVPGHVIVTTRRGGFAALGQVMDLDVMGSADSVRLLRTRVPDLSQETGEQIADELGRLPLALEQAAAYMDISQMPGPQYLELLRSRAADLYRRGHVTSRQDTTIATLWDISLEAIASRVRAPVQLLSVCAYLAPEPIPLGLFTAHPYLLPSPLSTAAADPLAFADTVAVLADYSLAKRTPAGLQLHRLVQATLRGRLAHLAPAADSTTQAASTPDHATEPAPEHAGWTTGDLLAVALGLLRADAPEQIMDTPAAWPKWAMLLPHVLTATSYLNPAIAHPNRRTLADASWLLDRAGVYLQVHALLTDAKTLLERALTINEAIHGPRHPDIATDLSSLARVLRDLGQPATALPLQERALAIDEANYGPGHPAVARDLNNLARILRDMGQRAAARPLQERALAIDEAIHGPDHPAVAADLNNLARILRDLGQLAAARPLQERALAIDEAIHGPDHPAVAADLNNLARILGRLGQSAAARPLQERAVAIDEATYGPDHPAVALDLNNLGRILRHLGQPATALPLQERALAIDEATYGPDHPAVARDLNILALILRDLGQPAAALPLLERAVAIDEALFGRDHPAVGRDLNHLAQILRNLGQLDRARPLQERSLAIHETVYGPDHPDVAIRLNHLAEILRDLGQLDEAQSLRERALTITNAARPARSSMQGEEKGA